MRDSPLPRFVRPYTPSDTILVFARKATMKSDDDEIIPPNEYLTIEDSEPPTIAGTDASVDYNSDEKREFNKKELRQIAEDIKLIVDSNPGCQELINSILEKAENPANPIVSKNPVTVFWAVA